MTERHIRVTESVLTVFFSTAVGLFAAGFITGQQIERSSTSDQMMRAFKSGFDMAMQQGRPVQQAMDEAKAKQGSP